MSFNKIYVIYLTISPFWYNLRNILNKSSRSFKSSLHIGENFGKFHCYERNYQIIYWKHFNVLCDTEITITASLLEPTKFYIIWNLWCNEASFVYWNVYSTHETIEIQPQYLFQSPCDHYREENKTCYQVLHRCSRYIFVIRK